MSTHEAAEAAAGRLPLLGGVLWLDALTEAGDRCECEGWCGAPHREAGDSRCPAGNSPASPLHVIPAEPDVEGDADALSVRLTVGQVAVVCRACHDRWARARQRHTQEPCAAEESQSPYLAGVSLPGGRLVGAR